MLKAVIAVVLAACGMAAEAQTVVTMQPAACGAGVWCATVPNDSGDQMLLYGSTNYQGVGVILTLPDGSQRSYQSLNYRGSAVIYNGTCPRAPEVGYVGLGLNGERVPMSGVTGPATITAVFTCTTHQGSGGRGNGPHQVWTLMAGTVEF